MSSNYLLYDPADFGAVEIKENTRDAEITRLREEIGRLTMALADAEARAERDYLRFVEADREEIERLREQIRLLTEDMPAGDARRILAEQRAEIHEFLKKLHKQSEEIARLKMLLDPLPAAARCQPADTSE